MQTIGKTEDGRTIAILESGEHTVLRYAPLLTDLVRQANETIDRQSENLPGDAPKARRVPAPDRRRSTRPKRKHGTFYPGKVAEPTATTPTAKPNRLTNPKWLQVKQAIEKTPDQPHSAKDLAAATGMKLEDVSNAIRQKKDLFKVLSRGIYALADWMPPQLSRADREIADADPHQLTPDAKMRRLELLRSLGKNPLA